MFSKGFHHIGLYVSDMERSLKFYQEALGGKVTYSFPTGPDRRIYMVELGPGAVVELIQHETGTENQPWAHIALWAEDTRAAFEKALANGATVKSEPHDGKLGDDLEMCGAFVYGPDGEVIEFFETK